MKNLLLLLLLAGIGITARADGPIPVIRRQHALCVFTFTGTNKLQGHILSYNHYRYFKKDSTFEGYDKLWHTVDTDPYTINIQEGGRRWDETDRNIYLSLIDTVKGITTDSLFLFGKDYNIHLDIKGIKDGKLIFHADSTKALYQYAILNEDAQPASFARNRILFIASSIIGLLFLLALYFKTKNKPSN